VWSPDDNQLLVAAGSHTNLWTVSVPSIADYDLARLLAGDPYRLEGDVVVARTAEPEKPAQALRAVASAIGEMQRAHHERAAQYCRLANDLDERREYWLCAGLNYGAAGFIQPATWLLQRYAQPPPWDSRASETLFAEGLRAYDEGRFVEA